VRPNHQPITDPARGQTLNRAVGGSGGEVSTTHRPEPPPGSQSSRHRVTDPRPDQPLSGSVTGYATPHVVRPLPDCRPDLQWASDPACGRALNASLTPVSARTSTSPPVGPPVAASPDTQPNHQQRRDPACGQTHDAASTLASVEASTRHGPETKPTTDPTLSQVLSREATGHATPHAVRPLPNCRPDLQRATDAACGRALNASPVLTSAGASTEGPVSDQSKGHRAVNQDVTRHVTRPPIRDMTGPSTNHEPGMWSDPQRRPHPSLYRSSNRSTTRAATGPSVEQSAQV